MSVELPETIGGGYGAFWRNRRRYRVVKGGRGSKKSMTASLWYIVNMMKYAEEYKCYPNLLVIRQDAVNHANSTFASLKLAINMINVGHLWRVVKHPLQLIYKPTGQVILFRGMNDPDSITSITVDIGHLCWVWVEEAYQITSEESFNKLDGSIRGILPDPLFAQITLTFNPWHEGTWLKPRFFDAPDKNTFAITRNYDCNEFLDDQYIELMNDMRENNWERFRVEGMGEWGVSSGLVYKNNWKIRDFDWQEILNRRLNGKRINSDIAGMDFGFTDYCAIVFSVYCPQEKAIYIYDEFYEQHALNSDIVKWLEERDYMYKTIAADNEDPKSITELRRLGVRGIFAAKKGKGSVMAGIFKLLDMKIYVHPTCVNTINALRTYHYQVDSKTGLEKKNKPDHDNSHIPDAMRYMVEELTIDPFAFK